MIDDEAFSLYQAGDRNALIEGYHPVVRAWVADVYRRLRPSRAVAFDDALQEGSYELVRQVGRILRREMQSGEHIRRSTRKAVKKSVGRWLTYRKRRSLPIVSLGEIDPEARQESRSLEYRLFTLAIADAARSVASGIDRMAVDEILMPRPEGLERRQAMLSDIARRLGISRSLLVRRLQRLAEPVAEALSPDMQQFGLEYFGANWPVKTREYANSVDRTYLAKSA